MTPNKNDKQLSLNFNDKTIQADTISKAKVISFCSHDELRRQAISRNIVMNTKSF